MPKKIIEKEERIITKFIAFALIVTLTIANFLLVGKETYAIFEQQSTSEEELQIDKIEARTFNDIEKYIKIDNVGVLLEINMDIFINNENTINPDKYKIEIDLPEIEGKLPAKEEDVYLITYDEPLGTDYDKQYSEGKLIITPKTIEGMYEYKIICIYPEEIWNEEEKELNYKTVIKAVIDTKDYIIKTEEANQNSISTEQMNENIVSAKFIRGPIYKGCIYDNEGDYKTDYEEFGAITISYLDNQKINFKEGTTKYTDGQEANFVYNSSALSMKNLKSIFGEDFEITISDGKKTYTINKDTQTDASGDTIVINYSEDTKEIEINTTEVKSIEKLMYFKNVKTLTTNNKERDFTKEEGIDTKYSINGQEKTFKVYLEEPKLNATIELANGKTELTALEDNNVNIVVTLLTNNQSSERLYNNPTLKIKMPENVTVKELKGVTIAGGEGSLAINTYSVDAEGNIIVTLNGEQKNYIETQYNAQITINAILEVNKLITNDESCFIVEVNNKDSEIISNCYSDLLDIKTYDNLFTHLKVENIDNGNNIEIYNSGEENKEEKQQIDFSKVNGQTTNIKMDIVNNYNIDLKNVAIKMNAIYTDKNGNKSNLIIKEENTQNFEAITQDINALTKTGKQLNVQLPNSMDYNEQIEVILDTTYSIDGKSYTIGTKAILCTEAKDDTIIETESEDGKITVQTTAKLADGTALKDGDSVYEGETITYTTTIINNTNEEIKNVNVKALVENGNIYDLKGEQVTNAELYAGEKTEYRYAELDTNEKIFETINIQSKEQKVLTYEAVVNQVKKEAKIESKIYIIADNLNKENIITNKIEESDLKVNIAMLTTESVDFYSTYQLQSRIKLENISGKDLNNVCLEVHMLGLSWNENTTIRSYNEDYSKELYNVKVKSYDKEKNIVTLEIENIEKDSVIMINFYPYINSIALDKENAEISLYAVCESKYKSNLLNKMILQSEIGLTITQSSNIESDKVLRNGDEVNIEVIIRNSGVKSEIINVIDDLPDGLYVKDITESKEGITNILNDNEVRYSTQIDGKGEIILKIKLVVDATKTLKENCTNIVEVTYDYKIIKSNEINFQIDLDYIGDEIEEPDKPIEPDNPDGPDEPIEPDNPDKPIESDAKYEISGQAWLDENKNGKRDENEKLLSGIKVKLLDTENNNNYLKDKDGKIIEFITKEDGSYKFTDIPRGKYLVVFEYDFNTYELTDYIKEGISDKENSDATDYILTEENKTLNVGITKVIDLNKNVSNIDIGLRYLPKFDLKIDKYITKVTTQTNLGVKISAYEGTNFAKTEIKTQQISGATVIIEYTIKITNNGELAGYARNIVDNMPDDMKFNSELNSSWYMGIDKKLYNTSLANTEIKPNESKEIKLILVKNMTKENTGTTINTVEIEEYSNIRELKDNDLTNNKSQATMMITPSTGTMTIYIVIFTLLIGSMGVGIYLIKKKILD